MKKYLLFTLSLFLASFSLQPAFAAPFQNLPPFLDLVDTLNCSVEGSIRLMPSGQNEITYKIKYISNYSKPNAAYGVNATSRLPTRIATLHLFSGKSNISLNEEGRYLSLAGASSKTFAFKTDGVDNVTVRATVDGVKCAEKTFRTLHLIRLIDINPDRIFKPLPFPKPELGPPAISPPQAKLSCSIYAEGFGKDDGSIAIGAVIDYKNIKKGSYSYAIRAASTGSAKQEQSYQGTYAAPADGAGKIWARDGRGFAFTYKPQRADEKFTITARIADTDCASIIFNAPANAGSNRPPVAPLPLAQNGDVTPPKSDGVTGATTDQGSANYDGDNSTDEEIPRSALVEDTGASATTAAGEETPWSQYALYALIAIVGLGAAGYGTYRLGRTRQ